MTTTLCPTCGSKLVVVDRYHSVEPFPMPFPAGMAPVLREMAHVVTVCLNTACGEFALQRAE